MNKKYLTKNDLKKVLEKRGFKFIKIYYSKNKVRKVVAEDSFGYKYDGAVNNLINSNLSKFVNKSNPYSLRNISLWLKNNKKDFKLCKNNQYEKNNEKLIFYCNKCKDKFQMSWDFVYRNTGCPICAGRQTGEKHNLKYLLPKLAIEFDKSNSMKPDDITLGYRKKVLWNCSKCNHSWMASVYSRAKLKSGCPACAGQIATNKNRLSILFSDLTKEYDKKKNDISIKNICYGTNKKVWWNCSICKCSWQMSVSGRSIKNNGCPECKSKSSGEKVIKNYLNKNNISYIKEYRFKDCRYKYPLPFDFYLPKYNLCIEFNGLHHYKPVERFGGKDGFKYRKKLDKIKVKYCKDKKIKLLIIPYLNIKNIDTILDKDII